jgi:hypothetical protein
VELLRPEFQVHFVDLNRQSHGSPLLLVPLNHDGLTHQLSILLSVSIFRVHCVPHSGSHGLQLCRSSPMNIGPHSGSAMTASPAQAMVTRGWPPLHLNPCVSVTSPSSDSRDSLNPCSPQVTGCPIRLRTSQTTEDISSSTDRQNGPWQRAQKDTGKPRAVQLSVQNGICQRTCTHGHNAYGQYRTPAEWGAAIIKAEPTARVSLQSTCSGPHARPNAVMIC